MNSVHGFLTDLWGALGIVGTNKSNQNGGNSSRYAAFNIGNETIVTIRASAHNADAENYLKGGNVNGDSNISIVLQKRHHKNTFKANEEVKLEEYVYEDSKIASVENPLSQIAMSLIKYLTDGDYVDTTGVAIPHKSPITKESKTHNNMKKQTIKLNETQLRKMIAESVKKILKEELSGGVIDEELEAMEKILNSIIDALNLNDYAPNGINGLDKERAISAIKNIKNGISTLWQATYNTSSEY